MLMGKIICKDEVLTSLNVCFAGDKIIKLKKVKVEVLEKRNNASHLLIVINCAETFSSTIYLAPRKPINNTFR